MKKITTLFTTLLFAAAVVLSNQAKAQSSCAWAKKAGGTYEDGGNAIATDAFGNVYALGYYYSTTIAFGATTLHNVYGAGPYMYLAKYDSCGTLQWAKQAGGNGEVDPNGIATDVAGNVYVTGYYNADTLNFGAVKLINAGGYTAFVAKYNSSGVAQWAQQGLGNAASRAYGVAADGSGNVYITGYFNSTSITFGSNSLTNGTNDGSTNDAFIAKFDNSGNNLWIKGNTSNGSTDGDVYGFGIGADAAGNVYVAGDFGSSNITFGATTLSNNGYNDIFVVQYNSSGVFQWLKTAGDADDDAAYGLAADAAGNVYVTGHIGYNSTVSFGTHSVVNSTQSIEAFIAKYDASGNDLWAHSTNGDSYSYNGATSISLDAGGNNAYITGLYTSDSLHVGPITLYNTSALNGSGGGDIMYDIFVAKYKSNGILSWARTAGGDSIDIGNGVAAGLNGALYITGEYKSPSINFAGITLTSNNSAGDAFIVNNISTLPVTPQICLVSDDSIGVNEYNYVYWDKTAYPTASTFIILREVTSGVYKAIGSQPYGALSQFMDTARHIGPANGDPTITTYRYKLQFIDTSGAYSYMSPYHNTVFFVGNNSGTFTWNAYAVEGMTLTPVSSVDLERDDNSTNAWHVIGSGAGTQTTLNDPNYSTYQATGDWRVSSNGFNCTPTLRLNGNNSTMAARVKSHSNQNNNRMSGIKSLSNASQVNIYPNPNKGNFTIETTATEKQTVQVFDVNGKLVYSQTINGNINVDASNLADGVYNVSIMGNEGVVNKRLVIVK